MKIQRKSLHHLLPLLAGVLLLFLAACDKTPAVRPLAPGATVLAFGDSLTAGNGAGRAESYPARLEELVGFTVVNAGVPGEVTQEGRARLSELLERHRPALLILCHGGNDLLRRRSVQEAEANLRAMVEAARAQGVDVVFVGVPKLEFSLAVPEYYEQIARDYALPYDGEILVDILSDRDLKSDYIHPNAEGYRQFAEALADLLKKAGAI